MLEGLETTCYGSEASAANRLFTVGGAVSVAAAAETPLTVASAKEFGYLVYMRADCTVAATTVGTWTLKLAVGGATALILQQPVATAVAGSSYCWPFPVPWKTATVNAQFSITPSVGTMGTWIFIVNGFNSAL